MTIFTDSVEPDPRINMMVGAFGEEKSGSDPAIEAALEAVRAELEDDRSEKYNSIDVISFREQTVAGRNYFIKVSTNMSALVDKRISTDVKIK